MNQANAMINELKIVYAISAHSIVIAGESNGNKVSKLKFRCAKCGLIEI